jgi:FKBP-type peptidyl-prolyl cis-trans isomerase 2
MAQAKSGDTVQVHYTGKLKDGTVFDSSVNREPLEFTMGKGMMIPGFEAAVHGMEVGDSKVATIPVEEAYGPASEDMLVQVERKDIPQDIELQPGLQLTMHQQNGQPIPVIVKEITDTTVTLDANHPLAGEDLIFEISLVNIA